MKKRYVIALSSATPEQNDAFRKYLVGLQVGWWHWFDNLWLVVDGYDLVQGRELRSKAREIYLGAHNLVMELRPDDDVWYGFGPAGEIQNMFKWLEKNWRK
jgi:hypothetical protein